MTTVAWILDEWPAWPVPSLARGITSLSPRHSSPHCAHLPSPRDCLSSPNCLWHVTQITCPQLFISTTLGVLLSVFLQTGHMYLNLSCSDSLAFTVNCTLIRSFRATACLPSGHVVCFDGFLIVSLTAWGATEGWWNVVSCACIVVRLEHGSSSTYHPVAGDFLLLFRSGGRDCLATLSLIQLLEQCVLFLIFFQLFFFLEYFVSVVPVRNCWIRSSNQSNFYMAQHIFFDTTCYRVSVY